MAMMWWCIGGGETPVTGRRAADSAVIDGGCPNSLTMRALRAAKPHSMLF